MHTGFQQVQSRFFLGAEHNFGLGPFARLANDQTTVSLLVVKPKDAKIEAKIFVGGIVTGIMLFDQVVFHQEGHHFVPRRFKTEIVDGIEKRPFHFGVRVSGEMLFHPVPQVDGFAHIQHLSFGIVEKVNARGFRQGFEATVRNIRR